MADAPKLTITVEPQQDGKLIYIPIAAGTSAGADAAWSCTVVGIENHEASAVHVTQVRRVPLPQAMVPAQTAEADIVIEQDETGQWRHAADGNFFWPVPPPGKLRIEITCEGFDKPATETFALVEFESALPDDTFLFPARWTDLARGEYWQGRSGGHSAAGGGTQLTGYDMIVVRYDKDANGWVRIREGGDGDNAADHLSWGKPIVAMADGVVQSFLNDHPDNMVSGDTNNPPVEGNHFYIQHEDTLVMYAHLQQGSLNEDLMTEGAEVQAGQQLGISGNSGRTPGGPHLHISAIRGTSPWNGPPWPIPFSKVYAIDRSVFVPPDPNAPWSSLTDQGLPEPKSVLRGPRRPTIRRPRPDFFEVAIDPLALILANHVYVDLTLPDPPPDEVLVEHARRLVRAMDAAERKEALENVDALKRQLDVLARELRREL